MKRGKYLNRTKQCKADSLITMPIGFNVLCNCIEITSFNLFSRLQKETLSDIKLHLAALRGDEMLLRKVLDSGKVHVDCKDEVITG